MLMLAKRFLRHGAEAAVLNLDSIQHDAMPRPSSCENTLGEGDYSFEKKVIGEL